MKDVQNPGGDIPQTSSCVLKLMTVMGIVTISLGLLILLAFNWQRIYDSALLLVLLGAALHVLCRSFLRALDAQWPYLLLRSLASVLLCLGVYRLLPASCPVEARLALTLLPLTSLGIWLDCPFHRVLSCLVLGLVFYEGWNMRHMSDPFFTLGTVACLALFGTLGLVFRNAGLIAPALVAMLGGQLVYLAKLPWPALWISVSILVFWSLALCPPADRRGGNGLGQFTACLAVVSSASLLFILSTNDFWRHWLGHPGSWDLLCSQPLEGAATLAFFLIEAALAVLGYSRFFRSGAAPCRKAVCALPFLVVPLLLLATGLMRLDCRPVSFNCHLFFSLWFLGMVFGAWLFRKRRRLCAMGLALAFLIPGGLCRFSMLFSDDVTIFATFLIYSGVSLIYAAYCIFLLPSDPDTLPEAAPAAPQPQALPED